MNILACACGGSLEILVIVMASMFSSVVVALEYFGLSCKKHKAKEGYSSESQER